MLALKIHLTMLPKHCTAYSLPDLTCADFAGRIIVIASRLKGERLGDAHDKITICPAPAVMPIDDAAYYITPRKIIVQPFPVISSFCMSSLTNSFSLSTYKLNNLKSDTLKLGRKEYERSKNAI